MSTFVDGTTAFTFDESLTFPDGQPHVRLRFAPDQDSRLDPCEYLTCRLSESVDIIRLACAVDVLRQKRRNIRIHLNILYMWGRMDRRLSPDEPYTLRVVSDIINSLELDSVSVFYPHSQATTDLLSNYVPFNQTSEDTFFDMGLLQTVSKLDDELRGQIINQEVKADIRHRDDISLVFTDTSSAKRFGKSSLLKWWPNASLVTMHKERDERTGKIIRTRIVQGEVKPIAIQVDDLCDGGASFQFANVELTKAGMKKSGLVVPHGVLSKGTEIPGIDYIYVSNSFKEWQPSAKFGVYRFGTQTVSA